MHDWTLLAIEHDWARKKTIVRVRSPDSNVRELIFNKAARLDVVQREEWGESVSINGVAIREEGAETRTSIEMQTGDVITIISGEPPALPKS